MSSSQKERFTTQSEQPLSSRIIYLPSENNHPVVSVYELNFGQVDLSRLARLTGGRSSRDWWVLNQDHLKNRDANPNCGRISWDFSELEDNATETRSNIFCKSASLIINQEFPLEICSSIVKYGPIKPSHTVDLELIGCDKEGKLTSNLWQLNPNVKFFLVKPQNGEVGELFIPHPGITSSVDDFNGIVNCWSISKRTMIRQSSGSVSNEQGKKYICGFDQLMHRDTQGVLILEHERYFKSLEKE